MARKGNVSESKGTVKKPAVTSKPNIGRVIAKKGDYKCYVCSVQEY